MSNPYNDFAHVLYDEVVRQGNLNGQRWHIDVGIIARLAEETLNPKPKATKKKASTKKAEPDGQEHGDT